VARRQAGAISTAQLIECALTKDGIASRVRRGHLHPVLRSVYAVGHSNLTRRGREWAVVLACGPDASLSHNTAGALFEVVRAERRLHVTAPRSRHARRGFTVHRSRALDPADRAVIHGLAVTSLHRTLIDLADVLPEKRLMKAIHEAEVRRLFDLGKLDEALRRAPGRQGAGRLRRACERYQPARVTRSDAEIMFHDFIDETGLPKPRANATRGGYELDCHWPEANLNVEVDGAATHKTTRSFYEDRLRDRRLKSITGIETVRVTWEDLTNGRAALEHDLREILARR